MARAYPPEFRNDVVAVARKHEAPISQIAKDGAAVGLVDSFFP